MFELIPLVAGALGGGGGGGGGGKAPSSNKQSQDGNTLNSGSGSFSVGGPPQWVVIALAIGAGLLLLAGLVWLVKKILS